MRTTSVNRIVFLILLLLNSFKLWASDDQKQCRDSSKIDSLIQLGDKYQYTFPDSAIYFYDQAARLAKNCDCPEKLSNIFNYKAIILIDKGLLKQAYLLLDSALKLTKDSLQIIYIKNNIATIYNDLKLYKDAFEIFYQQLKYFQRKHDTVSLPTAYTNLALIYSEADFTDSALIYMQRAFQLDKKLKDSVNILYDYYNFGNIYFDLKKFDTAKLYYDSALSLAQKINVTFIIPDIYAGIAAVAQEKGDYQKAVKYYLKSINLSKIQDDYINILDVATYMTEMFIDLKWLDSAKKYIKLIDFYFHNYYDGLSKIQLSEYRKIKYKYFKAIGNADSALFYYEQYISLKDSLDIKSQLSKMQILKLQWDAVNTKHALQLYKLKNEQKSRLLQLAAFSLLLFSVFSAILLYLILKLRKIRRQLLQKTEQLEQLIEKDQIQLSLYRIQQAALHAGENKPMEEFLRDILNEIINQKWVHLQPRAAIFLKDQNGKLKLTAHINLQLYAQRCQTIEPGHCLCGKAYETKESIICERITPEHSTVYPELGDHGHYIAPLKIGDRVFGVINLYLYPREKLTEAQKTFLDQLVNSLSIIIDRKIQRTKLQQSAIIQDQLNQKLFAQSLQLSEEKRKVEKAAHKIKQQAQQLSETLAKLQDSITYASYMLDSLLSSEEQLNQLFKEYFLIFKPIEKIGGDFYFASKVENKIYLAVGDATGHGIPGAIIAAQILGYLYEIIQQRKICEPQQILDSLRQKIKASYSQAKYESIRTSGVDIAMCVIDPSTNTLGYAGANIPLYIVRNKQLIKIDATKSPVGMYIKEKTFEQHIITLQPNDMLYLQSDGIIDLINKDMRKFSRRRYENLLIQISHLPTQEQKQIILQQIEQWRENTQQTDDIVVFGLRWENAS